MKRVYYKKVKRRMGKAKCAHLSLYARHLRPMLRESLIEEDDIDLNNIVLSHYRLSEIRRQDLKLEEDVGEYKLQTSVK